jgi:hypothetical protein
MNREGAPTLVLDEMRAPGRTRSLASDVINPERGRSEKRVGKGA